MVPGILPRLLYSKESHILETFGAPKLSPRKPIGFLGSPFGARLAKDLKISNGRFVFFQVPCFFKYLIILLHFLIGFLCLFLIVFVDVAI